MQTLAHIFQNADDHIQVRTLLDAMGNPWFCCTDVARAVGYKDPRTAVKDWMHERQNINEISMVGKYLPLDLHPTVALALWPFGYTAIPEGSKARKHSKAKGVKGWPQANLRSP